MIIQLLEKVWQLHTKLKIHFAYGLTNPLLGVSPRHTSIKNLNLDTPNSLLHHDRSTERTLSALPRGRVNGVEYAMECSIAAGKKNPWVGRGPAWKLNAWSRADRQALRRWALPPPRVLLSLGSSL